MYGSRGEIEITRHEGSELGNALRTALTVGRALDLLVLISFLLTFFVWWRAAGLRSWWNVHADWLFIGWAFLLAAPWFLGMVGLVVWYLLPHLRNVNWPPPFAQLDAANPNAPLTWADSRDMMPMDDEGPVAEPQVIREVVWRVEGTLDAGDGKTLHDHPVLVDAPAWHRFCKVVVDGRNFSYNEAVRRNGVDEDDWKAMWTRFVRNGWVKPAAERGTPDLSPTGEAWVRHYARTPPPPY